MYFSSCIFVVSFFFIFFFFFQAEDGIRDGHVTGVQTCALPISTTGRICSSFSPLLSYCQRKSCRQVANRLTVGVPHASSAGLPATRVMVVSALVTLRKLLLPVPRTKTSFSVEHRIVATPVMGSMNVAQVAILDCPPGVPSARAQTVYVPGRGRAKEASPSVPFLSSTSNTPSAA